VCDLHNHAPDPAPRRLLLTGGSGFVGRYLLPLLAEAGWEVHALGRRTQPAWFVPGNVHWHHVDLHDQTAVDDIVSRIQATHLVHLAWYAEHGKFWSASENLDCVAASLRLARAFVRAGGERIVATGTCAEYDWSTGSALHEELTPLNPRTLYGRAKASLFETLAPWADGGGVSFAWARLFFLYGPGEDARRLVPSLAAPLASGGNATCRFGDHLRDFLHVHDVASALAALLESDLTGPFNIASGSPTRLGEVAWLLARELAATAQLRIDALPPTPDNPAAIIADVTRLTRELGWMPRIPLAVGLSEAANLFQSASTIRRAAA
jgi:nucleoside-diphosphate-sugar epimerase